MALADSSNIIAVSVVFSALAILAVVARFIARRLQGARFCADDYLIIPGLVGHPLALVVKVTNEARLLLLGLVRITLFVSFYLLCLSICSVLLTNRSTQVLSSETQVTMCLRMNLRIPQSSEV